MVGLVGIIVAGVAVARASVISTSVKILVLAYDI
jgi:hypothetical protein